MKRRPSKQARPPIPWRLIAISVGAAVLTFAIGYVVAVRVLFPPLPEPKNGIVVPQLTGLNVPTAEARLHALGLVVTEVVALAHPSEPPGIIIAQSPVPGQQLRAAGSVRLGVSSGMPRVEIPPPVAVPVQDSSVKLDSTPQGPDTLRVAPDTLH